MVVWGKPIDGAVKWKLDFLYIRNTQLNAAAVHRFTLIQLRGDRLFVILSDKSVRPMRDLCENLE